MSPENLAMVVAALNCVGKLLKNNPLVPNVWIPHILAAIGILAAMSLAGFSVPVAIEGLIAGTSAVGVHQLVSQLKNGKNGDDEKTTAVVAAGGPPTGTNTT